MWIVYVWKSIWSRMLSSREMEYNLSSDKKEGKKSDRGIIWSPERIKHKATEGGNEEERKEDKRKWKSHLFPSWGYNLIRSSSLIGTICYRNQELFQENNSKWNCCAVTKCPLWIGKKSGNKDHQERKQWKSLVCVKMILSICYWYWKHLLFSRGWNKNIAILVFLEKLIKHH